MPLPMVRRFCCLTLETGCLILCIISTLMCVLNITAGAWKLPQHKTRDAEDNLISLSMIMFSSLSAISDLVAIAGICLRRPGYLQLSIVFNSVFIVCVFLVSIVTCIFRLDDFLARPEHLVFVIVLLFGGAGYSLYYLTMVNSLYRIMKMSYEQSAIPM